MQARWPRILFSRGWNLYTTTRTGDVRPFGVLRDLEDEHAYDSIPWAVSPEGRRIAWVLSDVSPERRRRSLLQNHSWGRYDDIRISGVSGGASLLVATDDLRDRFGRRVTHFSIAQNPGAGWSDDVGWWGVSSLSWSEDVKYVYVSLHHATTLGLLTTCVLDARTGRAVSDATGRWLSLGPMAQIDERGGHLAGITLGRTTDEPDVCNACSKYYPILFRGRQGHEMVNLLPPRFTNKRKPPYAMAESPAISPEGERIAFAGNGLWIVEMSTRQYRQVVRGEAIARPRWRDSQRLLYLEGNCGKRRLYEVTIGTAGQGNCRPERLLQNVDWFDILPE